MDCQRTTTADEQQTAAQQKTSPRVDLRRKSRLHAVASGYSGAATARPDGTIWRMWIGPLLVIKDPSIVREKVVAGGEIVFRQCGQGKILTVILI